MFTHRYRTRLEFLSTGIVSGVQETFAAYLRPFASGDVVDDRGRAVPDISPQLRKAKARVIDAAEAFERIAAEELKQEVNR